MVSINIIGFYLCKTFPVLWRPYSLTSSYFTFTSSSQVFCVSMKYLI